MILERHLATVMSVADDPEKTFGIKVQIDEILPGETFPELAYPLFPTNFIKMPKPGQIIEVVVRGEDVEVEPGEGALGVGGFPEFCYYTGRIFDLKKGGPPVELKKNYPKRSGWWIEDGTIIYIDETQGSEEIALILTGKEVFIRLQKTKLEAQFQSQKIILNSSGVAVIDTTTKIGSSSASNPLLKGTEVINAFASLFFGWQTALTTLIGSGGTPAGVVAYAGSLQTLIATIQGTLTTWGSSAHFTDGR